MAVFGQSHVPYMRLMPEWRANTIMTDNNNVGGANTAGRSPADPVTNEATQVLGSLDAVADPAAENVRKGHVWPWVVLAAFVAMIGAVAAGGWWYFESHALPGTTLWGNSIAGQTKDQIARTVEDNVRNATVQVTYNGKSGDFRLSDLGLDADVDNIAQEAFDAKRDDAWWQRYAFWTKKDVTPELVNAAAATSTVIDEQLGCNGKQPVDAQVKLNGDGSGFDVVPGQQGQGADSEPIATALADTVKGFGATEAKAQTVELKDINPVVTDEIATKAKATLDKYVAKPVTIKVSDHDVASIDAKALAAAMTIDANDNSKLKDNQWRDGYVVFDAAKLQKYYDESIKSNLKTGREDRETVVNNNGTVLQTISQGHDGVTIADGADTNIGASVIQAMEKGQSSITVEGKVDPMKDKTVKRHVVVDLSDGKVYAYENDQLIKAMNMSAGEGTVRGVGTCTGDLCTPTGDFTIWLKYPSQDMSGNLTLSDGSQSQWDVKDVGFVNYFSHSGCAIHRIVSPMTDAQIGAMNANTSHGCVGIGWDVAEWFYNWCLDGTSVHVQA